MKKYSRAHKFSTTQRFGAYLISILFAFSAPFAMAQQPSEEVIAGRVIVVKGEVIAVEPSGATRELIRRAAVYVGDTIVTSADSSAQLRMEDQALIALKESTQFAILEYEYEQSPATDASTLQLIEGGFRTITGNIGSQNRDAYETRISNFATIGIRGTDYEVVLTPVGGVITGVYDGGTTFSNNNAGGSIDLGINAEYDFAIINDPESPPVGLVVQPNELGVPPLNTNADDDGDDEDQDGNDDDADDGSDQDGTDDDADTDDGSDQDGGDTDGGGNGGGGNGNNQNAALASETEDDTDDVNNGGVDLDLDPPSSDAVADTPAANNFSEASAPEQENEPQNIETNSNETSGDGSINGVGGNNGNGNGNGNSDHNTGDDTGDGNSGNGNGNGNSGNGNGNGNSDDDTGNGNSGNGNGNGNSGNGNGNGNGNSDDDTGDDSGDDNGNGNSGNGNGNGNSGNGNGNGNSGDDTSGDDTSGDDTGDDTTGNGNGNGNSGNGNGGGNGNSGNDTTGDDTTGDDTDDDTTGNGNGNGNSGNGNGGGNGNSGDETSGDDTSSDDTSSDDTSGDDTTGNGNGNSGNGNGGGSNNDVGLTDEEKKEHDDKLKGKSINNGGGGGGISSSALLKPEQLAVTWGTWDNPVDSNFGVVTVGDKHMVQILTSQHRAEVIPTDIASMSGNYSYATTAASSFVGSGSAGDVTHVTAGMSVNFDTGVISNGSLAVQVADQAWAVDFNGAINGGMVELNASGGLLMDDTGLISDSIDANLGGAFTGAGAEAFVGGFDLIDELNPFNEVDGLFTIER